MKRFACSMLFFVLVIIALPAEAVTVTGRSGGDFWSITNGVGGQIVLTVYWNKKSAQLFLVGNCDDGASFVSGSLEDRFQRLEVGVDPGTTCDVEVLSRNGSSKYWLNIQGTGIFSSARTVDVQVKRVRGSSDQTAPQTEGDGEGATRRKSR